MSSISSFREAQNIEDALDGYDPEDRAPDTLPRERIREEAIQVAVMAMRVALEGDRSFEAVSYSEPGHDPA